MAWEKPSCSFHLSLENVSFLGAWEEPDWDTQLLIAAVPAHICLWNSRDPCLGALNTVFPHQDKGPVYKSMYCTISTTTMESLEGVGDGSRVGVWSLQLGFRSGREVFGVLQVAPGRRQISRKSGGFMWLATSSFLLLETSASLLVTSALLVARSY